MIAVTQNGKYSDSLQTKPGLEPGLPGIQAAECDLEQISCLHLGLCFHYSAPRRLHWLVSEDLYAFKILCSTGCQAAGVSSGKSGVDPGVEQRECQDGGSGSQLCLSTLSILQPEQQRGGLGPGQRPDAGERNCLSWQNREEERRTSKKL